MKKLRTMLLVLCLLLPACALAVTEGVVEQAPMVEMESVSAPAAEISYLPDASYYEGYGDWNPAWEESSVWVESRFDGECYHDVEQRPRMTAGEAERAKSLLAAYQAGVIRYEGESILNKMEDVIVGVYALNPEEFDGEAVYVILPGPCMTDEQLLAVIAAYDEMGLIFDPDALSYRNCARGGGIETTRFLVEEERERYTRLADMIERGLIDPSDAGEAEALQPKLDSRYFCGMPDFTIRPYRAMTDEEFVAQLADMGCHDMTGEIDYSGVEKESRAILNKRLGTALSMELSGIYNEGSYLPNLFDKNCKAGWDWSAQGRRSYGASFEYYTEDGILVYVNTMFDYENNKLVRASAMHSREDGGMPLDDDASQITNEQIMAVIADTENRLGVSGVEWHVLSEDATWTNWGECIPVRAQIAADEWMTIYIGKDDGKAHGFELSSGTQVEKLPDDDMPVNG